MAQGAIKKSSGSNPKLPSKSTKGGRPSKSKTAPSNSGRVAKPQKEKAGTNAAKMRAKYTGAMVGKTEKLLGERVGHLELLGQKGRKKGGVEDRKGTKGGSRKFG